MINKMANYIETITQTETMTTVVTTTTTSNDDGGTGDDDDSARGNYTQRNAYPKLIRQRLLCDNRDNLRAQPVICSAWGKLN